MQWLRSELFITPKICSFKFHYNYNMSLLSQYSFAMLQGLDHTGGEAGFCARFFIVCHPKNICENTAK